MSDAVWFMLLFTIGYLAGMAIYWFFIFDLVEDWWNKRKAKKRMKKDDNFERMMANARLEVDIAVNKLEAHNGD